MKILITGGAGFIGSHLADELLRQGHDVRILDNLSEQVHGNSSQWPSYLDKNVELIHGDVRGDKAVQQSLKNIDVVYHLAARVGVGQSMYQVSQYISTNDCGTATLLQALAEHPVQRLIVASSMSVYGEGMYVRSNGDCIPGTERPREQLQEHRWELTDGEGQPLTPVPTPETKPPSLASVYALSKYDQERLCLLIGEAYHIPTVALRFFNVYGPRQALSNPYTGVLAIFAARLLNEKRPLIFEDGNQQRDFVHVTDVARACRLAMEAPTAAGKVINIASGEHMTINHIARQIAAALNKSDLDPLVTNKFRTGDIRHCFADISQARQLLDFKPAVGFEEGILELVEWLQGEVAVDKVDEAEAELEARGLTA